MFKKLLFSLILCLVTTFAFSQISELVDIENDEIYGYLILQNIEKVDRKTDRYMLTLLDINLNPVSQTKFESQKKQTLVKTVYNGNSVYFHTVGYAGVKSSFTSDIRNQFYQIYDLEQNKVSANYELPDKLKKKRIKDVYPIINKGFGIITEDKKGRDNHLYAISNSNNVLYETYPYGENKKRQQNFIEVKHAKDSILTAISTSYPSKSSKKARTSLLIINTNTGKTVKEVKLDDKTHNLRIEQTQIVDDKIYAFGEFFDKKQKFHKNKTEGIFKAEINHKGDFIQLQKNKWMDLVSKFDIKPKGKVTGKGFMSISDFVIDRSSGHTLVAAEYFKKVPLHVVAKDGVILDFDKNFNLKQTYAVETKSDAIQTGILSFSGARKYRGVLETNNYFDYSFNTPLEDENGISLLFTSAQRGLLSLDVSHNIITYSEGHFFDSSLDGDANLWKNELIIVSPSKPGHILLSMISKDKIVDQRIERIDY